MINLGTTGWKRSTDGRYAVSPLLFSLVAQPGDETFLLCGGFWVGLFLVLFAVLFWFCFCVLLSHSQFLHTKAVESFKSQWKGTGLTPGLMSWSSKSLYVSLTWTAGILEIGCSLRVKKKYLVKVHWSLCSLEPGVNHAKERYVLAVIEEDLVEPLVVLKVDLPPYVDIGAIRVLQTLTKRRLILQTRLDLVCGPGGEICACYHNGHELLSEETVTADDGDFFACWLDSEPRRPLLATAGGCPVSPTAGWETVIESTLCLSPSLVEESSYACDSSVSEGKESSDSEPAMSEVSDQYSMLEHAYQSIRNVFSTTSEGKLVGGWLLKSTGKSSGSLAISQAYVAVEVWGQSTRRAVGRLPDGAQGHALGSI